MVNFGAEILYLLSGAALVGSFKNAMRKTCLILSAALVDIPKAAGLPKERFLHYFQGLDFNADEVHIYVDVWFKLSNLKIDDLKQNPQMAVDMLPNNLIPSSMELQEWLPVLRCFLVCFYYERAILLPYGFMRPQALWLSKLDVDFNVWPENLLLFITMEAERKRYAISSSSTGRSPEERKLRRLIQNGLKVLLTTNMYGPEDLNVEDLQAWRTYQTNATDRKQSPVPMKDIVIALIEAFPSRVSADVGAWTGGFNFPPTKRSIGYADFKSFSHLTEGDGTLEERMRDAFAIANVDMSALSIQGIIECGAVEFSSKICPYVDIQTASEVWLECEQHFFRTRLLELERPYHTCLGRLNAWLFIYLPLWFAEHGTVAYMYPETPALFTAHVHYFCIDKDAVRPLSLVEWMKFMGWKYNSQNGAHFRSFFDELIGSQMPGCEGLRQPVIKVPKSKKYRTVTKNAFIGDHFMFFVNFLHSLEMLSGYFSEHSEVLHKAVLESKKNGNDLELELVGVVPCFFIRGKIHYIKRVSPELFSFIVVKGHSYYYPGLIRFILVLLEAGPRGQAAQWIDAREYDQLCDRLTTHPFHLTLLWLNTDKVSSVPIVVVTIMRVIQLMDAQRDWLVNMSSHLPSPGLSREVDYDGRKKTKWKKIAPLFLYNFSDGTPFTDSAYSLFWTEGCLAFQAYMRINMGVKLPLVAFLPIKSSGKDGKGYFEWGDFEKRKITEKDVKVFIPNASNVKSSEAVGAPYCPVRLRCKITPHGARASFVTELSSILQPELVIQLTGQSLMQVRSYDKGDHLRRAMHGVFNGEDNRVKLKEIFKITHNMDELVGTLEGIRDDPNFADLAEENGWISLRHTTLPNGLGYLASDKEQTCSHCDTHVCPLGFICNKEVILTIGKHNCQFCSLAIFSVHNIVAVAMKRQAAVDRFLNYEKQVIEIASKSSPSQREIFAAKLNELAKDALGWAAVEHSLWAVVQSKKNRSEKQDELIVRDKSFMTSSLEVFSNDVNSPEDFLYRVGMSEVFPDLTSETTRFEIDRAARLLLAGNSQVIEALTAPVGFGNAEIVVSMIRSLCASKKLDLPEFMRLLHMDKTTWLQQLEQHQPNGNVDLGLAALIFKGKP